MQKWEKARKKIDGYEVLVCLFCGGDWLTWGGGLFSVEFEDNTYVRCLKCKAGGPSSWEGEEAVGFWNKRQEEKMVGVCPFCNAKNNDLVIRNSFNYFYQHCSVCGAKGPGGETEIKAIELWNVRIVGYEGEA